MMHEFNPKILLPVDAYTNISCTKLVTNRVYLRSSKGFSKHFLIVSEDKANQIAKRNIFLIKNDSQSLYDWSFHEKL